MTRAYVRVDPGSFERKVIQQRYPPLAYAALVAVFCLAESQPVRGRFRDERMLRAMLGPLARQVPFLRSRGDVVDASSHRCDLCPKGHGLPEQLYVDGWDEWQEGDVLVKERMARVRDRKRNNGDGADRNPRDGEGSNSTVKAGRGGAVGAISGTSRRSSKSGGGRGEDAAERIPRDGIALAGQTRPDLVALRGRGMHYIRQRELEILDAIADNEREGEWKPIATGQEVIAGWIRGAPKGVHLVDYVIQTENDLKRERGFDADEADAQWEREKAEDKASAPERLGVIIDRLVPEAAS